MGTHRIVAPAFAASAAVLAWLGRAARAACWRRSWTRWTESHPSASARRRHLREELSEAELRVMRYLPSNLKATEIAAELFVSPNTVSTHPRHVYAKLDATAAARQSARARELGLLAPGGRAG